MVGAAEAASRFEVGAHEAVKALQHALGLGIAGLEDAPVDRQGAAEGEEGLGGATGTGVDRPLAVPDHRLGQGAELGDAAAHPPDQVGDLAREDQRPGTGAGVAERRGQDPGAAGLAVADGDLRPGLHQVELQDLPGAVGGALVGARRGEARADLAQVIAEDRLAALIARGGDQLHDPRRRQAGVFAQELFDLALEGIELGGLGGWCAHSAAAPWREAQRGPCCALTRCAWRSP